MNLGIRKLIGRFNEKKAEKMSVKEEKKSTNDRIATILDKNSTFMMSEAYKATRTNIIFTLSNIKHNCKKIIITSSSPGEGKTTTCLNLAIVFAQTGSKVLVIGADLRKPRLYRHLQVERKNGLSDVLCGFITLDEAIKPCSQYGIDCITAGQVPPNPIELLASDEMGKMLEELSERYDYILIDTPPVTIVSDATAMSKYVDGVIVVVRQNYTIHESLEKARNNLDFANAKILGYILNDVTSFSNRYGNYKNYGQGAFMRLFSKGYGKSYTYVYGDNYSYGYGYGYGYRERDFEIQGDNISRTEKIEENKKKKEKKEKKEKNK